MPWSGERHGPGRAQARSVRDRTGRSTPPSIRRCARPRRGREDRPRRRPSHHDAEDDHDHYDFESFGLHLPPRSPRRRRCWRRSGRRCATSASSGSRVSPRSGQADAPVVQAVGERGSILRSRMAAGEARETRLVVMGETGLDPRRHRPRDRRLSARGPPAIASPGSQSRRDRRRHGGGGPGPEPGRHRSCCPRPKRKLAARLAQARRRLGDGYPRLRLANLMQLAHPMSVDGYVEDVVAEARLLLVRLLGGVGYWRYGVEQVAQACRTRGIALAVVPGDDKPDPELASWSTLGAEARDRLWLVRKSMRPAKLPGISAYAADLSGRTASRIGPNGPLSRRALLRGARPALSTLRAQWTAGAPVAPSCSTPLVQGGASGAGRCLPMRGGGGLNRCRSRASSEARSRRHARGPVRGRRARTYRQRHVSGVQPRRAEAQTPLRRRHCRCPRRSFAEGPRRTGGARPEGSPPATSPLTSPLRSSTAAPGPPRFIFKGEAEWHRSGARCTDRHLSAVPPPTGLAFTAALASRWAGLGRTAREPPNGGYARWSAGQLTSATATDPAGPAASASTRGENAVRGAGGAMAGCRLSGSTAAGRRRRHLIGQLGRRGRPTPLEGGGRRTGGVRLP